MAASTDGVEESATADTKAYIIKERFMPIAQRVKFGGDGGGWGG
jgi:hypothetical protein